MKKSLLIFGLVLICFKGYAAPDKYTRYLLNEPATMMDLFLNRMERRYQNHAKRIFTFVGSRYQSLSFTYKYDSNRIYLKIFFNIKPEQRNMLKIYCEYYKSMAKTLFDADIYSSHYGWEKKSRPKNLEKHIKKIAYFKFLMSKPERNIVLEGFLNIKPKVKTKKKGDLENFSCEGPLFGKKILYSD